MAETERRSRSLRMGWRFAALLSAAEILTTLSGCSSGGSAGNTNPPQSFITSVSVTCTPTSILMTQTSVCTATVQGTGAFSSAVNWSATDGSISSSGVYTPTAAGTATIIATSTQDTSKSGSATVAVTVQRTGNDFGSPTVSSADCTDATTCTVTLTGSIGAGDLLLIAASTVYPDSSNNGTDVDVSSISNCGTWQSGYSLQAVAYAGVGSTQVGYVYPATATAGPCVVTFTATSGGANVVIYDYPVLGGATPVLDCVNSYYNGVAVTSPFAGTGCVLSGNDAVLSVGRSATGVTAVSSPWTNAVFDTAESGMGAASQVNVTSVTAPTWTASGATNSVGATIAVGVNTTPCVKWGYMDSSAGTNGAALVGGPSGTGTLSASSFGMPGAGTWAARNWEYIPQGSNLTYSTAAFKPLINSPARFCTGGETYPNASTLGINIATSSTNFEFVQLFFPGWDESPLAAQVSTTSSACVPFYTTIPANSTAWGSDMIDIRPAGSDLDFIDIAMFGNGTNLYMAYETPLLGAGHNPTDISPNTWYYACVQMNAGATHYAAIYDSSGTQLGTTFSSGSKGTSPANVGTVLEYGELSGNVKPADGYNMYFGTAAVCWANGGPTCPLKMIP